MLQLRTLLTICLLALLAACDGGGQDNRVLPTIASLPSPLPTPAATSTALPTRTATATETPSATMTSTISVTPSMTITDTPTPTVTLTPSETVEPNALSALVELALQATILPNDFAPPPQLPGVTPTEAVAAATPTSGPQCQYFPSGGFGMIYADNPSLAQQLGCPVGAPPVTESRESAAQPFESGAMVWLDGSPAVIYALYSDGTFRRFDDTYDAATDPERGSETPPAGLYEPVRGFGKVWRTFQEVRNQLGWATAPEAGSTAVVQDFANGRMLYVPSRGDILVLIYRSSTDTAGSWQALPGQF